MDIFTLPRANAGLKKTFTLALPFSRNAVASPVDAQIHFTVYGNVDYISIEDIFRDCENVLLKQIYICICS